ncbi:non-ribosomal peptide synthetase [Vibrio penaeicida]|uniref:non-ribosomal peptide synthetase n=1 Tax=Vibrio penaeicida TaxID=104609 RepID=UPI000F8430FA|nr:non-ribosomal peptide synthetase [Vibrio penaeicida]RTZ24052.1 amino acid adenylation domain-containing protein [Vibrio penaeicida]
MNGERKGRLSLSQKQREKLLAQRKRRTGNGIEALNRQGSDNTFPVSELQQDMWVLESLHNATSTSNIPCMYSVEHSSSKEHFDVAKLRRAMSCLIQRYESLRTVFVNEEGQLKQRILPNVQYEIRETNLSDHNQEVAVLSLDEVIQQDIAEAFNVNTGPMFRVHIIRCSDTKSKVVFVFSHLIFDGGSIAHFERDFFHFYLYSNSEQHPEETSEALPALPVQPADYAHWMQQEPQKAKRASHLAYWKTQLAGCDVDLALPYDRTPGIHNDVSVTQYEHVLPTRLTRWLKDECAQTGTSLYSLLLATYGVLLHRITGQTDVAIASAFTNRNRSELEHLIGLFAREALLRVRLNQNDTFSSVKQSVQQRVIEAIDHSELSLGQINRELGMVKASQDGQVARTLFLLREHKSQLGSQHNVEGWEPYGEARLGNDQNRYDLSLVCRDEGDSIRVSFNYKPSLFNESTVAQFAAIFERILQSHMEEALPIGEISLIPPMELSDVYHRWNGTQRAYSEHKTLHGKFEEQAKETPDNTALIFEQHSLTYRELNQRANQLAHKIRTYHLNRNQTQLAANTPVALYLDRSLEMVIAILAVMKSGGAYVPIATDNPTQRTRYILEDTQAQLILTQERWQNDLLGVCEDLPAESVSIDEGSDRTNENYENVNADVSSSDMAYIIYTSGTTGQPKGVMVPHKGVVNRLEALQNQFPLSANDRVLQKTPYTFDVSVWELLWANWTGAAIVMAPPKAHQSPEQLHHIMTQNRVTVTHFVPPMLTGFSHFLSHANQSIPSSVRRVFCSGEALTPEHIRLFNAINQHGATLHNQYGPTEASIEVSVYDCLLNETETVPIGRPIQNVRLLVMDPHSEHLQLCPEGLPGELYIGGIAVTQGYLNQPNLTKERFVDNPFATKEEIAQGLNKLYKTGDLVRRQPNGNIEYLGRNDFQVKVRGYRIELEEIEAAMQAHPRIKASCVHTVEGAGEKSLVGYYVEHAPTSSSNQEQEGVALWKSVYEAEYKEDNQTINQFDIRGWKSSFTQLPIPPEEMKEWVDATVTRIQGLNPNSVLEIGSGSGLIFYPLLPSCTHYIATDFSTNAMNRLSSSAKVLGYEHKSEFVTCPADEVANAALEQRVDTVVMNSVSQYFPNAGYLDKVIEQAIESIEGEGNLFFGDIRDQRLLRAFHLSILAHRNPEKAIDQLVKQATWLASKETELAISPTYFLALMQHPAVDAVQVLPKRGFADHEMNRFRYDVIVQIKKNGAEGVEAANNHSIELSEFDSVEYSSELDLPSLLASSERGVWIKHYPDARVWGIQQCVMGNPSTERSFSAEDALSIEVLHLLAEQQGVTLQVLLATESEQAGALHLFFSEDAVNVSSHALHDVESHLSSPAQHSHTNSPDIGHQALTYGELSDYLALRLPEYMVPVAFVPMKDFPLSSSGKLDRNALPEPELIDKNNYVAPDSDIELELCSIWKQVLGIESIGVNDNFFRIGGDSIIAIQLVSKIRKAGFHIQVKDMFDAPTVKQLALVLADNKPQQTLNTEQGELEGEFSLLPIQTWFFNKGLANPHHWNQAFTLRVPAGISQPALEAALFKLSAYHDAMRIRFEINEGSIKQRYCRTEELPKVEVHELNVAAEMDVAQQLTAWQSDFDIENGPLWRAAYLTGYPEGEARLWFAFHHLIIDAVSWRIIAEDLETLLSDNTLSQKGSSYRQWVRAVEQYRETHVAELPYWQDVLSDTKTLPSPQSDSSGAAIAENTSTTRIEFPLKETHLLLHEAHQGYNTEINDLLLSALSLALNAVAGQSVNHITLEGHGREAIDPALDISRTLGWFTTAYPLRLEAAGDLEHTIIQTKETLRGVPNKGIGFGAFSHTFSHDALPKIYFNYLGQLDSTGNGSMWEVVNEDSGNVIGESNRDSALLNINGGVFNGQLQFDIISQLPPTQTMAFRQAFDTSLHQVLEQSLEAAKRGGVNTASDFGCAGLHQSQLEHIGQSRQYGLSSIAAIYPASSLQQGFVYHHISQPEDDAYRLQVLVDYDRAIDVDRYFKAWELASFAFPALRIAFHWEGEMVQVIGKEAGITSRQFTSLSLADLPEDEHDDAIIALQSAEREKPFDLTVSGLMRVAIIKRSDSAFTLIQTAHHSITDGWSNPILLKAVHRYYDALSAGQVPHVVEESVYGKVQMHRMAQRDKTTRYWSEKRSSLSQPNDLGAFLLESQELDSVRSLVTPSQASKCISGKAYQQLKSACQSHNVTLNVALQFAWHKLIQIYTQDVQTIVGTTVSGRDVPIDGIEESVGLYINTLPLAVNWTDSLTVAEALTSIHRSIAELNSFSGIALADLQEDGKRLFQSLFIFENYPSLDDVSPTGLSADSTPRSWSDKMDYPFSVMAYEKEGALSIQLGFDQSLMEISQVERLLTQLESILQFVAHQSDESHHHINVIDSTEQNRLIHDWNTTQSPVPSMPTWHQLFEAQVQTTPNAVALTFQDQHLTYQELNQKANQLAHTLRQQHVIRYERELTADTPIALYLDRSVDMVVSILAVLKAGGAYVPVSPEYPKERAQFILEDTAAPLVLTQQTHLSQLDAWLSDLPQLPELVLADNAYPQSSENLNLTVSGDDLAYIIYTSGTTGKPKGVMMPHSAYADFIHQYHQSVETLSAEAQPVSLVSLTQYTFDIFGLEYGLPLLSGGTVHLSDIHQASETLSEHASKTNVLQLTPSVWSVLQVALPDALDLSHVTVIVGGESGSEAIYQSLSQRFKEVIQVYGPTEACIWSTQSRYQSGNAHIIGTPLSNERCYVLSDNGKLCPIGVPGELHIGGAGLARGYLNRGILTAEQFIDSPIEGQDERLYKTGDWVRWRHDGQLEYIGRNDSQVKIRGYRIELGEIEATLMAVDGVQQAVVIDREKEGDKYLAAYLVSDQTLSMDDLRHSLNAHLPDYMVPATFNQIEAIPLTLNGKLDRRVLPEPEWVGSNGYVAPESELEIALCDIWSQVLGLERVGVHDSFFQIGGNSINAIKVISQINQLSVCHQRVELSHLFNLKTIAELHKHLQAQENSGLLDQQVNEMSI